MKTELDIRTEVINTEKGLLKLRTKLKENNFNCSYEAIKKQIKFLDYKRSNLLWVLNEQLFDPKGYKP